MNNLAAYSKKWNLHQSTLISKSAGGEVYKVQRDNQFRVLKIFFDNKHEARWSLALQCFAGHGAAHLIETDDHAHLLEFIDGPELVRMVENEGDEKATQVVSEVIAKLHSYSDPIPNSLVSMETNFRSLFTKARGGPRDSIFWHGARVAERLLETEREVVVLHGDLHHKNILKSPNRGWLAIDPKGLRGERTYDVTSTFYNPQNLQCFIQSADTIEKRCRIFSQSLELEMQRILDYALAYGCLSAAWHMEDGTCSDGTLKIVHALKSVFSSAF